MDDRVELSASEAVQQLDLSSRFSGSDFSDRSIMCDRT